MILAPSRITDRTPEPQELADARRRLIVLHQRLDASGLSDREVEAIEREVVMINRWLRAVAVAYEYSCQRT